MCRLILKSLLLSFQKMATRRYFFLSDSIEKIIRSQMHKFIMEEVLEKANTAYKLFNWMCQIRKSSYLENFSILIPQQNMPSGQMVFLRTSVQQVMFWNVYTCCFKVARTTPFKVFYSSRYQQIFSYCDIWGT